MKQSVLIVDDEQAILEGLRQMLLRNLTELDVITCSDGLQACEILRQKDFDVIISDVMMPEMTGIQLLQQIQQREYVPGVLMISGYDDFHYVRESMRLGASDYLLKPIQQEETLEAVQKLLRENRNRGKNVTLLEDDEDAFSWLVHQKYECRDTVKVWLRTHDIREETMVWPFLIRVRDSDTHLLETELKRTLPHRGVGRFCCFTRREFIYLLVFDGASDSVVMVLNEIQNGNPGYMLRYGTPTVACEVSELPTSIDICRERMDQSYFDFPMLLSTPEGTMEDYLAAAGTAVKELNETALFRALHAYLACAQHQRVTRTFIVKSLTNWLYSILSGMSGMIRIVSKYKLTEYDLAEQIRTAPSLSILEKRLTNIWSLYLGDYKNTQNRRTLQMDRVMEFVRTNLADNCQIADAAALIGVSPNYLSTIFREHMGVTFRDYVREERIKKAMQLIQETNLKLYEIADEVGYQDAGHFSRAFKQVTGHSPQYYMKKTES